MIRASAATIVAATALGASAPGLALAAPAPAAQRAAAGPAALADPDTVVAEDGRSVTYGTSLGSARTTPCPGVAKRKLFVPILVSGSGATVGTATCHSGDALPGGPGSWALPGGVIWAPGVVRYGGRYLMYYTASAKGAAKHKCIGRAVSASAYGPFKDDGRFVCPKQAWAIDANPFVSAGTLFVTYRDDSVVGRGESGISTVQTDANGRGLAKTRRVMLKSTDITWDTKGTSGGSHIIENPSMFNVGGRWYLMWSGNQWQSARYSTGIADCGPTPLPRGCRPMRKGAMRPYFGFTGKPGIGPLRGLPGNFPGAAGMDVFQAADGSYQVSWAWFSRPNQQRYPLGGTLSLGAGGFNIT